MAKIICPKCGEVNRYCLLEKCHQYLLFDANNEPCGSGELIEDWASNVPRCIHCNRKVKFKENENGNDD